MYARGTWDDYFGGYDNYSEKKGFVCEWDQINVSKPTDVVATQPASNHIKLTWKAGQNAKKYAIFRADGDNEIYTKIGTTKKLKFTDITALNGNSYRYRVESINGSSTALSSTVDAFPMKKPTSVKASFDGKKEVTVTWKKVAGANKYQIYQKAPSDSNFKKTQTVYTTKARINVTSCSGTYKFYIVPVHDYFQGTKSSTVTVDVDNIVYRALVVGQTYANNPDSTSLPSGRNNAEAVGNMLEALIGTEYVKPEVKFDLTKEAIMEEIEKVFSKADANDVTLLYFSGHGVFPVNSSGQPQYNHPSLGALYTVDGLSIQKDELRSELDRYKGKKIILLESCYSGNMIGKEIDNAHTEEAVKAFNSAFIRAFYSEHSRADDDLASKGYYVLTACSRYQVSYCNDDYSDFTYSLLYGLGWDESSGNRISQLYADTNNDKRITWAEAYEWARKKVHTMRNDMDVQVYPVNCAEVFFAR